jgi:membrane-associated phospholipid phosphatase
MPDATLLPDPAWPERIGRRVGTLWPIKMLANIAGVAGFFAVYFWVQRLPHAAAIVMPLTALDRWLPFQPAALALYASLWVYIALPFALLRTRGELVAYGVAAFALSAIAMTAFVVWPTAVPQVDIDWSQYPAFEFLRTVDAQSNACPSLHVAFAVFSALWLARLLRETRAGSGLRGLNALWCAGILYSTLATRQHVVLDVVAGAALGGVVAALHMHRMRPCSKV